MTTEIKMMNDGARGVQAALAKHGIEVKHGVMLEALAAGFGARNWRTLRDKLGPTGAAIPAPIKSSDLIGGRWQVFATYADNDQSYSGYYGGKSAEEAMVHAQVERIFAEFAGDIFVNSVQDRTGVCKPAIFGDEDNNTCHAEALSRLMRAARAALGPPPSRGVVEADTWDEQNAHIEMFEECLQSAQAQSALNHLDVYSKDDPGYVLEAAFTFVTGAGQEFYEVCASEALGTIVKLAQTQKVMPPTNRVVYQAQALLKYAANELDFVFYCHAKK
ncbi:MAG: glyoxalase superfamily protein [Agitococcus sp.]|nr:glyoxalase superfamily protein [Agitococcus sp.]MDO9179457.1 glyoxalase superfamily protein [Agitococcus sp.]